MWRRPRAPTPAAIVVALVTLVACGGGGPADHAAPAPEAPGPRGASIYALRCAPCHGPEGGGDGPAAASIDPKPRNFRDAAFWHGRTAEQLRLVVRQGKPGTLMPPFEGVLSSAEIDDVVGHLESFRPAS